MLLRLQNSVAAMSRMMRDQERIANNLANVNTAGYKRDRLFVEALNERIDHEGSVRSDRVVTQWADLTPGRLEHTGNPLDLALDGEGFFVFFDEETGAARYTRAGRLTLDPDGFLRDPQGFLLEGEGGPIEVPKTGDPLTVDEDGTVRAGTQLLGRIRIVTFEQPERLQRIDGAAFDTGGQEPLDVERPVVRQGYLEGSNVDAVREMVDMIETFRQFESQQKMLQTTDQILGAVTRELGKF